MWVLPILVCAATLGASFLLKLPCSSQPWYGARDSTLCYSDIPNLYAVRQLEESAFPPEELEYPAANVLFAGAAASITSSSQGFFIANAVGLTILGLAAAWGLQVLVARPVRTLLFALGPPLFLYGLLSWDLLAVGLMVLALVAFVRRSDGWAGFLAGLGAAAKLFPGLLIPAFLAARWMERHPRSQPSGDNRTTIRRIAPLVLGSVAGFGIPNVVLIVMNVDSWRFFWEVQGARGPGEETWWFMIAQQVTGSPELTGWWAETYPTIVNILSAALFGIGAFILIRREATRAAQFRPASISLQLILWFMVTGKVFSLQYSLWVLPFFVLIALPWYAYVAYVAADFAVWVGFSAYYEAASFGAGDPAIGLALTQAAAITRYAVLLAVIVLTFRARPLIRIPQRAA